MLQLTKTGEYAVRAMLHMAALPSGTVALIADIGVQWDVPESFLRKIVAKLAQAGLLVTYRGNGGGVALARPATGITLLDVIQAAEGDLALNTCIIAPDVCHRTPWCPVHTVWCEAQEKLREVLSARSLADLAHLTPPECLRPLQESRSATR